MTDTPAELLRQLAEGERVLWHARPRFLRLKARFWRLLVTCSVVWLIAFLGRHSLGCMVETWAKILSGILLAIPACKLVKLLWYLFTTSQTHYTLTNRRAIISRGAHLVEGYPLAADMLAKVETQGNNCASVFFSIEAGVSFWRQIPRITGQGFIDTPDAAALLELLATHAQASAPRREAAELDRKTHEERYRELSRKGNLVLFICGILAGLFFLGKGVEEFVKVDHLNNTGIHTTALVLDSRLGKATGPRVWKWGHDIYVSVIFHDTVPHHITLHCRNGEDARYFSPGATLPLVYPAPHPEAAQLTLPWEQYHQCIWAFILSLLAPVCAWQVRDWLRARRALKTFTHNPS
ncbi:MAG: hypothetical protein IKV13_06675 [Akkermansia sp.]|nr:hypothetical protein [Akkermansia sp.]